MNRCNIINALCIGIMISLSNRTMYDLQFPVMLIIGLIILINSDVKGTK